jgi:predicted lipid carrier protein YhbT
MLGKSDCLFFMERLVSSGAVEAMAMARTW